MNEAPIDRLLTLMARLRDPERGCAWDVAQSYESIAPYTIEEAYEVADAVERGDRADLRDELGDLLLQVVFQARLAEEEGAFRFDDVAEAICAKLIRRHPHVFDASGDFLPPERRPTDPAAIQAAWEAIKARERADKAAAGKGAGKGEAAGPLAGVSRALPALARADRISKRAAAVGFDWPDAAQVLAKVREESELTRVFFRDLSQFPELVAVVRDGLLQPMFDAIVTWFRAQPEYRDVEIDWWGIATVLGGAVVHYRLFQETVGELAGHADKEQFVTAWVRLAVGLLPTPAPAVS